MTVLDFNGDAPEPRPLAHLRDGAEYRRLLLGDVNGGCHSAFANSQ